MNIITKTMYTETGHRLVDYPGKCAHLHGHSYKWTVAMSCETLDELGMVADFGILKHIMKSHIGIYDHAFILCEMDPLIKGKTWDQVMDMLRATNGERPRVFITEYNPTAENLAREVFDSMAHSMRTIDLNLRPTVRLEYVEVQETATSVCRYSGRFRRCTA